MVTIAEFSEYVEKSAFPNSLKALAQCESASEITMWRERLIRDLRGKTVLGENLKQLLEIDFAPQDEEESKEELSMPKQLHTAVDKLTLDLKLSILDTQEETKQMQEYQQSYMTLNTRFANIQDVINNDTKQLFEKNLQALISNQDCKIDQKQKMVLVAQEQALDVLQKATAQLAVCAKPRDKILRTRESSMICDKLNQQLDYEFP